jgi:hypothetical protein
MIQAYQEKIADPDGRKRPSWRCWCEVEGRDFEIIAKAGAIYDLCRELVEASIADQAMEVTITGLDEKMTFSSFHEAAKVQVPDDPPPKKRKRTPHPWRPVSDHLAEILMRQP